MVCCVVFQIQSLRDVQYRIGNVIKIILNFTSFGINKYNRNITKIHKNVNFTTQTYIKYNTIHDKSNSLLRYINLMKRSVI